MMQTQRKEVKRCKNLISNPSKGGFKILEVSTFSCLRVHQNTFADILVTNRY